MKKTFAFFTPVLQSQVDIELWRGISDYAVSKNINVFSIVCGRIKSNDINLTQRTALIDMIENKKFDGAIIWASSIFTNVNQDDINEF